MKIVKKVQIDEEIWWTTFVEMLFPLIHNNRLKDLHMEKANEWRG